MDFISFGDQANLAARCPQVSQEEIALLQKLDSIKNSPSASRLLQNFNFPTGKSLKPNSGNCIGKWSRSIA